MSQKLPLGSFKSVKEKIYEDFMKNYNEKSDEGSCLETDIHYPDKLHDLHNDSNFCPERIEIEKVETLMANLYDKKRIFYTYKKLKTITISHINIEKNAWSH